MERFDTQNLWVGGKDGYVTYRIPAITKTKKGTLLAFCEARKYTGNDSDQIDLLVRRSTDNGNTFSPPQLIATQEDWVCGNPAPVVDQSTGSIWLPFCKNHRDGNEIMITKGTAPRTVWITVSHDDGISWDNPTEITEQVKKPNWSWYATGPGHGIQLSSGRLLIPCNHIEAKHYEHKDPSHSHVIFSDNGGNSWNIGGSVDIGTDECTAVETSDGYVCLNCRNDNILTDIQGGPYRGIAWSIDGGETFQPTIRHSALPDSICQASIFSIPSDDGRQRILFTNPSGRTKFNGQFKMGLHHDSGERSALTVRLSYDGCRNWPLSRIIHSGPAAYSDLCVANDGMICCLFEGGGSSPYESISLARFNLEWVTYGADRG